ncbi:MAG: aminopeptidase P family N-terminal domain-containing protein [Steroidobacteraceae bacterium]
MMPQLPIDTERRLLLNRERADALMERQGYDALLAGDPVNVYYFSNFWTVLQLMGFDFTSLALLPRAAPERHTLVLSAAQIWRLEQRDLDFPPQVSRPAPARTGSAGLDLGGRELLAAAPATPWPMRADELLGRSSALLRQRAASSGHEAPTAATADRTARSATPGSRAAAWPSTIRGSNRRGSPASMRSRSCTTATCSGRLRMVKSEPRST